MAICVVAVAAAADIVQRVESYRDLGHLDSCSVACRRPVVVVAAVVVEETIVARAIGRSLWKI